MLLLAQCHATSRPYNNIITLGGTIPMFGHIGIGLQEDKQMHATYLLSHISSISLSNNK